MNLEQIATLMQILQDYGTWEMDNYVSVKSRSGHLITCMGCPLQLSSKLQTQTSLSTMESEYIALSQVMREMIRLREILKELYTHVLNDTAGIGDISHHLKNIWKDSPVYCP